jgi:hypothetical protein
LFQRHRTRQKSQAPRGWRSPRRCARSGRHQQTPQGLGMRWPSAAFRVARRSGEF